MFSFQTLRDRINELPDFVWALLRLSAALCCGYYLCAMLALLLAPHSPNLLKSLAVARGLFRTAPALLASGLCAAVLCDLMHRQLRQ